MQMVFFLIIHLCYHSPTNIYLSLLMAGVSVSYLATFSIFTLGITIIYFRKILFILDLKKGF